MNPRYASIMKPERRQARGDGRGDIEQARPTSMMEPKIRGAHNEKVEFGLQFSLVCAGTQCSERPLPL